MGRFPCACGAVARCSHWPRLCRCRRQRGAQELAAGHRPAAHGARLRPDRGALPSSRTGPGWRAGSRMTAKLEARVQQILAADAGREGRPDDAAGDRPITPDEVRQYDIGSVLNGGGSWPGRTSTPRRRTGSRSPTRTGPPPRAARRRAARDLGHRRRARQQQRLRRDGVPAQHRAWRRARPVPGPRHQGRDRRADPRHRPGLGVRADARRRARRPVGPHLRGLLRGPADHARLRLRGRSTACRAQPPRHRRGRRDRHRQALHRRRRHRPAARTRASTPPPRTR